MNASTPAIKISDFDPLSKLSLKMCSLLCIFLLNCLGASNHIEMKAEFLQMKFFEV
jgi:hypothetical protein